MDILRGPCIALAQVSVVPQQAFDPSNQQVTVRLKSVLDATKAVAVKNELSEGLGDYVYFPLHHLLQKDALSDRQTDYLLQILTLLFDKAWETVTLERASQLLSVVVYLVSPEPPGELVKFREKSTELHTSAFRCMYAIIKACERSSIADQIAASPSIPHIITVLLASLQYDSDLSAHSAALGSLSAIWDQLKPDQMALLLPGIASKLVNFTAMMYEKAHIKARAAAVRLFAKIVVGCLADDLQDSKVRGSRWKSTAIGQVNRSIDTIYGLLPKANPEVVLAAVEMASLIAHNCSKSIEMEKIIEILVFGSTSTFDIVSNGANDVLGELRAKPEFSDALEKHSVALIDSLGSRFNSYEDTNALVAVNAISKSLKYEKSEAFLNTLLTVIDRSLVLTKPRQTKLPQGNDLSLADFGLEVNVSKQVELSLTSLLHEVGRVNGKPVLSNLLDTLQSTPNTLGQTQLLWIAAHVLQGYEGDPDTTFDYLDFTFQVVAAAGSLSSTLPPSLVGLSVNLLGRLALNLGTTFEAQLTDVLFPVVNLLGSDNGNVTYHAKLSLAAIAQACRYPTPQVMILANKDYILDGVSIKLNTMDIAPTTPAMLSALINMAGDSIIPYLDDIVASLFVILDNYHAYSVLVTGIFSVFTTIAKILVADVPKTITAKQTKALHFENFEDMIEELKRKPTVPDLPEAPEVPETEEDDPQIRELDPDADDIDKPMSDEEEWDSPVPKSSYMIAKRVMGYADRFLTHKNASLRFNLLKLIISSLPVLATSDKELLPAIHKLWPVLMSRLEDSETFVVEAALECVAAISTYTGDFVTTRFQELWPSLKSQFGGFIGKLWPQFSSQARLGSAFERCLVQVVANTPLSAEVLDSVITTFKPGFKRGEYLDLYTELESVAGDQLYVEMIDVQV